MKKNGFFQLVHRSDGTYIRLIPPADGGDSITTKEVMEYLAKHNVSYEAAVINKAVNNLEKEEVILVMLEQIAAERESYELYVSQDKMKAVVRFYPPSEGAEEMTSNEFYNDLKLKNICAGIRDDAIAAFFQNKEYCTDLLIAEGKTPRMGTDGKIEYYFNTEMKVKPEVLSDGSVDFHKLNSICHCKKGDVLAKLILEDIGDPGYDIYGTKIKPREVKKVRLEFGNNIEVSEDRTVIKSMVNGHVSLVNGKVTVTDVLEVENVGTETGDIQYEGSVQIAGNVSAGYAVHASGNIEVKGVVEGAVLESGGNITIARGVNGMGKGLLKAKGYVIAKFIENASVIAGTYINAGSILHSNVKAGTEIEVSGKKGFITGGNVSASYKIEVKTLGSPLGAATVVEVGINPMLKKEQSELQAKYRDNIKNIQMIEPVISALLKKQTLGVEIGKAQMDNMRSLAQARRQKMDENKEITMRLEELGEILTLTGDPVVIVRGEVYSGTKICIGDVSWLLKDAISFCKFIKRDGEVQMTSI